MLLPRAFKPYIGISGGYIFCHRPASPVSNDYNERNFWGGVFSGQFGATYNIMHKLGINAEFKATRMKLYELTSPYNRYSMSVTAGLRYYF